MGVQPERFTGFYKKHEEGGYWLPFSFAHVFGEQMRYPPFGLESFPGRIHQFEYSGYINLEQDKLFCIL